jgi:hypothetical protein
MKDFVSKYGTTVEVAGKVVLDAKFFPKDSDYCLQIVNYIQPNLDYDVKSHFLPRENGNKVPPSAKKMS